jgi:hypothetical protein
VVPVPRHWPKANQQERSDLVRKKIATLLFSSLRDIA